MSQTLCCSAANAVLWGDRGCCDGSTPYAWLSSITLLPWLPGFLHRHFPLQYPPSHPLDLSLHSLQQASPWELLHNLWTPASSHCTFQGIYVPVPGMYGCSKDCLILIPFRLPQINCFTLSLKFFSSDSDSCPRMRIRPLLQFPHPLRASSVLLTLLSTTPPLQFLHPTTFCVVLYILFNWSGTPSALNWRSTCTSLSEVYSWCICGERCTTCSPTPQSSCSQLHSLSCPSLHEMFPDIPNSLEEFSSLSNSIVFLCFFPMFV